jgi:hypothetical protein
LSDTHPANSDILLEEGPWKVVKTVEDKENCEIWHHCADPNIEFTYITTGDTNCYGCDAEVPEKIQTIAALYSKDVMNTRGGKTTQSHYDKTMMDIMYKMYKQTWPGKTGAKLTGITNE